VSAGAPFTSAKWLECEISHRVPGFFGTQFGNDCSINILVSKNSAFMACWGWRGPLNWDELSASCYASAISDLAFRAIQDVVVKMKVPNSPFQKSNLGHTVCKQSVAASELNKNIWALSWVCVSVVLHLPLYWHILKVYLLSRCSNFFLVCTSICVCLLSTDLYVKWSSISYCDKLMNCDLRLIFMHSMFGVCVLI
jgi:hypothetical protein